jgi:hypothetical protein
MPADPRRDLADDIASFADDPLGHAIYAFPWGTEGTALEHAAGPRKWQGELLATIGDHLRDPAKRYVPLRLAIASGHGIGKSAAIAMVSKWAMDCWTDARVVVTANTEQQLLTKTSPEVAKWHRLAITRGWFRIQTMKISATRAGHADSWRLDFATWSEHNTEAFAGLHNLGRIILIVYDEGSNIADKVWEVTEGALTDEKTVIIWIAFGNPTRNSGRFRECFARYRHLWITRQIDSRDVEGTNKAYLQSIVDTYGEDSDIAKVRVLGQFPSASSLQFIASAAVEAARARAGQDKSGSVLPSDPVVFGVDHARFGDDQSVLAIRQGRDAASRPWKRWRGATSMEIAGDVHAEMIRWKPDAVFIDAGGPNAGGVIDALRALNPDHDAIFEVHFGIPFGRRGRQANWTGDARVHVANKRAEMWCNMKAWLGRGILPDEQQIQDDLTGVEYGYDADMCIMLEKKAHMKARGLASPDNGDALALTFAEPIEPRLMPDYLNPGHYGVERPFDRYAEGAARAARGRGRDYDRYRDGG